ncbi:transcription factor Sox-14-like [Pollicipes pollicipes]|uniref:transcription factor Sox-14-like n=1 Tax=Pollicipes pollicipes TaxID=41117 RepID=UPI001884E819|nr:transcription factor Sox-14-like [Pollicipes pollicipes]
MCRAMALNLTEYKIRYPDFPKYIWDSTHPYSDIMSIKKDRRNPEHTKRPLNAFMLFAKIQREHITTNFNCNHSEISKALGKLWQDLSREEKDPFTQGAKTLVELHRLEYPDYKYRPRKKGAPKEPARAAAPKKSAPRRAAAKSRSQQLLQSVASPAPASAAPDSPLSSCCGHSPVHCGGLASPASVLHTPYSPVSIGSSSGYESELPYELGLAQDDPLHGFSPEPESEIDADLRDIEVTALGESAILNPLTMFPTLGLTCDDLDDLRLQL